jgi:hypothetical protein
MAKVQPNRQWGALLARLRHEVRLTGSEVVQRLADLGVKLDKRTLYTYENGRVMAPDAAVVWGLAVIYGASLNELVITLIESRNAATGVNIEPRLTQLSRSQFTLDAQELIGLIQQLPKELRAECDQFVRFQTQRARVAERYRRSKLGKK